MTEIQALWWAFFGTLIVSCLGVLILYYVEHWLPLVVLKLLDTYGKEPSKFVALIPPLIVIQLVLYYLRPNTLPQYLSYVALSIVVVLSATAILWDWLHE